MNFSNEISKQRILLMVLVLLVGIVLTAVGWMMTGGLGTALMVVGVVCILAALYTFLSLRGFLILVFFVIGLVLTIVGWKMTGKLEGLGLMLVGIVLLLTALFVYNAPYRK